MVLNSSLVYVEPPSGFPIPGKTLKKVTDDSFNPETIKLDGGVLIKTKAISLDPYMRGRMRSPEIKSYAAAYELGKPIQAYTIGEVLRSEHKDVKVGQHLYGFSTCAEYVVVDAASVARLRLIENKEGLPWTTLVGAAGMSGQTAYWSFYNIGKPVKGETIFISAAAGAVGQIVGQLAKREGLKVVGSAGDDAKVKYIKEELGFDVAFNYKTQSTQEFLEANPPDIFFDNVGGETLDLVLATIRDFGRIIACGAVSQYNLPPDQRYGLKNYPNVVGRQLTYQGFIISSKDLSKFFTEIPGLIASGGIKVREHVTHGIDDGEAFLDMLTGKAQGKAVISLVD